MVSIRSPPVRNNDFSGPAGPAMVVRNDIDPILFYMYVSGQLLVQLLKNGPKG